EVEALLRVPTLGLVPSRRALERRGRRRRELVQGDRLGPFALVSHADMSSVFSEAFRNLRTSLLYSAPDHPPKTLLVTSLYPEDGKTSLVSNLAITLAQLGAGEVLLIDADMRRPSLHEVRRVAPAPGLAPPPPRGHGARGALRLYRVRHGPPLRDQRRDGPGGPGGGCRPRPPPRPRDARRLPAGDPELAVGSGQASRRRPERRRRE